jgi:hypothetical protein
MFIRAIKRGKRVYYFIAKTIRKNKKVIQKSVLYIGTADSLYEKLIKLKRRN